MIETEDSVAILEAPGQAEGESGSETIGFSTFGSQRINDAQKRRTRPCSLEFQWNYTGLAPQRVTPIPPAYWGTFITTFDGKILAGARNDGLGATYAQWSSLFTGDFNGRWSDGTGGNVGVPTYAFTTLGLAGARCGVDIFIDTLQTNVNVNLFYTNPYIFPAPPSLPIVVNKVPQIGSYTMPGAPVGTPPFVIVRRRPEGYSTNEDGAQVFISIPYASTAVPAGFVNPASVGVIDNGFGTFFSTSITP